MKTIFTLLLSSLFSFSSFAFDGTRLTVTSMSSKSKLFVEVDGRRYNLNGNTVSLSNIRPGVHTVRVMREVNRNRGRIDIWSKREEVIYSIKASIKNGYHFDILVNRFGKVMIDERRIDYNDEWYNDDDYGNDRNDRNRDYEDDRNDRNNRDWEENRNDDDDDYYDNDRDNRNNRDPRYDDNYHRVMSSQDFTMIKESLRKEWFENTRLTTAKQIIDKNYFTSQQVKELMFLFTFENNRLDIAKHAYANTVDKKNYYLANEAMTFEGNKQKLNEYIRDFDDR